MNRTTTHARWRVLPVHLVAKLFGVLIKVEGMPFGSSRTHLANPPRREDVVGSQVGGQLAACGSSSPPPDRDRDALVMILTQVICQSCESFGRTSPSSSAQAAAIAFRAGLDAFAAQVEPVVGGAKSASASESISHMPTTVCRGDGPKNLCECFKLDPAVALTGARVPPVVPSHLRHPMAADGSFC